MTNSDRLYLFLCNCVYRVLCKRTEVVRYLKSKGWIIEGHHTNLDAYNTSNNVQKTMLF